MKQEKETLEEHDKHCGCGGRATAIHPRRRNSFKK